MTRKQKIDAGKVWEALNEARDVIFTGSETAVRKYVRTNFSRKYWRRGITVAKVIYEPEAI